MNNLLNKNKKTAFSLIELSLVILIITILITGSLSASKSFTQNAQYKVTNERIKAIYQALGDFVKNNRRLPCPAPIKTIKTDSTYGTESDCAANISTGIYSDETTPITNLVYGMLPIKALGLPKDMAEDGFGSKFAYIVDDRFTNISNTDTAPEPDEEVGFGNYLHFSSVNNVDSTIIQIKEKPADVTYNNNAIFALISYGSNKYSAFGANSDTQNSLPLDSDEQENQLASSSPYFNNILYSTSENSDDFDDVVFYKSRYQMVIDFDMMNLMFFEEDDTNYLEENGNNYYKETLYYNDSCSHMRTQRQTAICVKYGSCQDNNACPAAAP